MAKRKKKEKKEKTKPDKKDKSESIDVDGISTGGEFLCASAVIFGGVYITFVLSWLVGDKLPLDFGGGWIVAPLSLVSLLCSIIELLAGPRGKEWLFVIPTLGPLLPLATTGLMVYSMFFGG